MRPMSDETTLLREAIRVVLDGASEPMTAEAIFEHPEVYSLGLERDRVSRELNAMHRTDRKPWPLHRIPTGVRGRSKWEYFNPDVVKLTFHGTERRQEPPQVNDVNPPAAPEFEFNPVAFADEPAAAPCGDASVAIPAGVKSITLTVSGVTVRIELN